MKELCNNLRLLGIVLYLCHRWLEVLYWPGLVLVILSSVGLLFVWKENNRSTNIWNIVILIAALLVAAGF